MSGISPCLWFDGKAEEAARFYIGAFRACGREAASGDVMHTTEAGPGPAGRVLMVEFTLDGQRVQALNGGPEFTFSPAISLSVSCADQAEVDAFWNALMADGGTPSQCGWLTDRFGVSWQVVPRRLPALLRDPNPARAARAMRAMMGMVKIDVAALEAAAGPDA